MSSESFKVIVEDDTGRRSVIPIELGEIGVGRHADNVIRLNERNVSRRHAKLSSEPGGVFAVDLDSYNGVYLNGERIKERVPVCQGDVIGIGEFKLELQGDGLRQRTNEATRRTAIADIDDDHSRPEATQPGYHPAFETPDDASVGSFNVQPDGDDHAATWEIDLSDVGDEKAGSGASGAMAAPKTPEPFQERTAIIRNPMLPDESSSPAEAAAISGICASLICVSSQFAGQRFQIDKTETVLGRTADNDIELGHRSVSRHHARIVVKDRDYVIKDLGSANGTLVNGEEYAEVALHQGDLIELGHVQFRFVPPEGKYNLTAAEQAVIDNVRDGGRDDDPELTVPGVGLDLKTTSRRVTLGQTIGLMLVAVALAVGVSKWVFQTSGQTSGQTPGQTPAPAPTSAAATPATSRPLDADRQPVRDDVAPPVTDDGRSEDAAVTRLLVRTREEMARQAWDEATSLSDAALAIDPENANAQKLQARAISEAAAKAALGTAAAKLAAGEPEAARQALDGIGSNSYYFAAAAAQRATANEAVASDKARRTSVTPAEPDVQPAPTRPKPKAAAVKARSTKKRRSADGAAAKKAKARQKAKARRQAKTLKPRPKPQADPQKLYQEGGAAVAGGDLKRAVNLFSKCIQTDRSYGRCYRALGITYARMGNMPKAARYYRLYLKNNPKAPDAAQVKQILEQYERAE